MNNMEKLEEITHEGLLENLIQEKNEEIAELKKEVKMALSKARVADQFLDAYEKQKAALKIAREGLAGAKEFNCGCGNHYIGGVLIPYACIPCEALKQIDEILEEKHKLEGSTDK